MLAATQKDEKTINWGERRENIFFYMPGKIFLALGNCMNKEEEVTTWKEKFNFEIKEKQISWRLLDTAILIIPHAQQLKTPVTLY